MNCKVVSVPLDIAAQFNNFCIKIGPKLAKKIIKSHDNASIVDSMPSPNPNSLFLEQCTVTEIITTTNTLASTSGVPLAGFSSKIMKSVILFLAESPTDICNSSFISSVFLEN